MQYIYLVSYFCFYLLIKYFCRLFRISLLNLYIYIYFAFYFRFLVILLFNFLQNFFLSVVPSSSSGIARVANIPYFFTLHSTWYWYWRRFCPSYTPNINFIYSLRSVIVGLGIASSMSRRFSLKISLRLTQVRSPDTNNIWFIRVTRDVTTILTL